MVLPFSNKLLRIAVIGAGVMGQHHLRICSLLKGVDLVGLFDIHPERAQEVSLKFSCKAYSCLEDLLGKVDAVIIATPTQTHTAIGLFFLQQGVHCLIEKPLALTEQECLSLITLADQKGLILAVGHVEHYNAGVQALKKLLEAEDHSILSIDAFRLNYGSRRISDVDVVLDLMVHDLEIVESFIKQSALTLEARSVRQVSGQQENQDLDHVVANLIFTNGATANLTASRITPNCIRKLSITTDKAYFSLDYQSQELLRSGLLSQRKGFSNGQTGFTDSVISERVPVRLQDSLASEISAFRDSVLFGTGQHIDGRQALSCLKLAWRIQEKAKAFQFQPAVASQEVISEL